MHTLQTLCDAALRYASVPRSTWPASADRSGGLHDDAASTSSLYKSRVKWCFGDNRSHTASYGTVPGEFTHSTAAPEGGARTPGWEWVRGCVLCLSLAATAATAQDLPSGQTVTLDEVLIDQVGAEAWMRFRFLAPAIAGGPDGLGYAAVEGDFAVLCEDVARPYLAEFALDADVVVISMMDRAVPFGVADAEATQFFETFRVADGACAWQAF